MSRCCVGLRHLMQLTLNSCLTIYKALSTSFPNSSAMSFNNFTDLERVGSNKSHRYRDYPEFESLSASIDNQLSDIKKSFKSIKKELAIIKNNTSSSDPVISLFTSTSDKFKTLNTSIKELNTYILNLSSQHEDIELINYLKQKESLQINLIKDSINTFKRLKLDFNKLSPIEVEPLVDNQQLQLSLQLQQQQQIQITYEPLNAEELEQQTLTIQQREQEIHKINQDNQEINEIFENLSSLVQGQQFSIDNIESNIFNYSTDVRNASRELNSAERYQKRSGGRMFCCLFILLGVLAFIIMLMVIF